MRPISLEVLKDCLNEIYNAKGDKYIEEALKIYIYKLANIIDYPTFKKFINDYKLTDNEIILSIVNEFLSYTINSLEELESLSQIYTILLNSSKVVDKNFKINVVGSLYADNIYHIKNLRNINNKNEILKIVTSEQIDNKDVHVIIHSSVYFTFTNEILSIIRIIFNFNCTKQDYEFLNKVLNDKQKYYQYYINFCKYLNTFNDNIPNDVVDRVYINLRFYDIVNNENLIHVNKKAEPKKKNINKTNKRNKIIEEYLSLCDEEADNDINPSKLIRKK